MVGLIDQLLPITNVKSLSMHNLLLISRRLLKISTIVKARKTYRLLFQLSNSMSRPKGAFRLQQEVQ